MSEENNKLFDFKHSETAYGTEHKFIGPNMPQYANGVHLMQPMNDWANKCIPDLAHANASAKRIVWLLTAAYEAGRKSMAQDLKNLLMIKDNIF